MRSSHPVITILALLLPATLVAQPRGSTLYSGSAGGLHVGTPAIVSASVGAFREISESSRTGRRQSVFAVVEPGVKAGRISAGFGDSYGTLGTGWTIRASALRVWRGDVGNYLGAEVAAIALGFGPRVGVFRQVGGGGAASMRVTADFAFGL